MQNFTIREAREGDSDCLLTLFSNHAFYEEQELKITQQKVNLMDSKAHPLTIFVVETDCKIKGYLSVIQQYSTWKMSWYLYVDCLYLEPCLRGIGIGKQLMEVAYDFAKQSGIDEIQWQTPSTNYGAIRFYETLKVSSASKKRFFWYV